MDSTVIDRANRAAWDAHDVVSRYERLDTLFPAERAILKRIEPELRGRRLLDIGVGAGRTTSFLLEISADYTAIDYSERMIHAVRTRFRTAKVLCCDARDLHPFRAGEFDFVLFSFNGIDYMALPERTRVLAEVERVLRRGGIFVFSSHNLGWIHSRRILSQCFRYKSGVQYLTNYLKSRVSLPRHWWLRRYEIREDGFWIVNDRSLNYKLLTFYISIPTQIQQLSAAGFVEIVAFDSQGEEVTEDGGSPFIYYLARKSSGAGENGTTAL